MLREDESGSQWNDTESKAENSKIDSIHVMPSASYQPDICTNQMVDTALVPTLLIGLDKNFFEQTDSARDVIFIEHSELKVDSCSKIGTDEKNFLPMGNYVISFVETVKEASWEASLLKEGKQIEPTGDDFFPSHPFLSKDEKLSKGLNAQDIIQKSLASGSFKDELGKEISNLKKSSQINEDEVGAYLSENSLPLKKKAKMKGSQVTVMSCTPSGVSQYEESHTTGFETSPRRWGKRRCCWSDLDYSDTEAESGLRVGSQECLIKSKLFGSMGDIILHLKEKNYISKSFSDLLQKGVNEMKTDILKELIETTGDVHAKHLSYQLANFGAVGRLEEDCQQQENWEAKAIQTSCSEIIIREDEEPMMMLQQILRDMWVDPELLAELGEDQKQILFCKMREEQVRRWKIWDEQQNTASEPRQSTKVKFLLGADGEPWTWVMGEHPNDRSIEAIMEAEAREKARTLAEKETQELRKSVEAELCEILDMNQRQIVQLEAAKQRNRLRGSPPLNRKIKTKIINDEMKEGGKCEENESVLDKLGKLSSGQKVSAAVEQWEQKVMEERTRTIFCQLRRKQLENVEEAEDLAKKEETLWLEQERRAKEAENQIREIARRARTEHKRSSISDKDSDSFADENQMDRYPSQFLASPGIPLTATRPPNRHAIIEWFQKFELKRGAAVDQNNCPEPWFHGLISRQEAERMLAPKPVGSFLLRLSERIWGYAISYRDVERCKHYLIDASNAHYQFLGAEQMQHATLGALVAHHEQNPITSLGEERLLVACTPEVTPFVFYPDSTCPITR